MRQVSAMSAFLLILSVSVAAAGDQRLCEMQARDYANLVAPRTGASALNHPPGLPTPNPRDNRPETMRMAPNMDAYRRAYDACMGRG